jgi:hypothetical protein
MCGTPQRGGGFAEGRGRLWTAVRRSRDFCEFEHHHHDDHHHHHSVADHRVVRCGRLHSDVVERCQRAGRDTVRSWPDGTVHGCPFIHAATVHPDPTSRVHAFAREQRILMLTLVTAVVAELGIDSPQLLAEQLVTLADGAVSRAMVLDDPD